MRLAIRGLRCAGADRAVQIVREDITQTMAMIGCPNISALGREFVMREEL